MDIGRLPVIMPISDLRQNMAEVMESIDNEKCTVVLTKHGRGKYVLLGIEDYNRTIAVELLYRAIDEGLADIEAGRVTDFREFVDQLREELGNG